MRSPTSTARSPTAVPARSLRPARHSTGADRARRHRNKSRLGANAMLGVSLAAARAPPPNAALPLWRYLGGARGELLPVPMMNVLNGGVHADNSVDFQEFMIVPVGAQLARRTRCGSAPRSTTSSKQRSRARPRDGGVGDEGGFAPDARLQRGAARAARRAIEAAGYRPGDDVAICLDPASQRVLPRRPLRAGVRGPHRCRRAEMVELLGGHRRQLPDPLPRGRAWPRATGTAGSS